MVNGKWLVVNDFLDADGADEADFLVDGLTRSKLVESGEL